MHKYGSASVSIKTVHAVHHDRLVEGEARDSDLLEYLLQDVEYLRVVSAHDRLATALDQVVDNLH